MSRHSFWILSLLLCAGSLAGCNLPLCENGSYYCAILVDPQCPDNGSGKDCEYRELVDSTTEPCILYECRDDVWAPTMDSICQFGYQGNGKCTAQCEENTYVCMDEHGVHLLDTDDVCTLNKCEDGRWQEKDTCKFGYRGENKCISPCEICENRLCPAQLVVGANLYSCSDRGWEIDHTCGFDIADAKINDADSNLVPPELETFKKYAVHTPDVDEEAVIEYGECGECLTADTPDYCTVADGKSVFHRCSRGRFEISVEPDIVECNKSPGNKGPIINCIDDFREIYVDTTNNRYHCGSCNHACGSTQICRDGKCVTDIQCVDGYAKVQVGNQWFNARCIADVEQLIQIGTELNSGESKLDGTNYDNAYVLLNDIEITEDWVPIGTGEHPFTGILLGNGNTITIHKNVIPVIYEDEGEIHEVAGLFGVIENSRIELLKLVWNSDDAIHSTYFGILAGHGKNINVNNIVLSMDKPLIVEQAEKNYIGGLVGQLTGSRDNYAVINNVEATLNMSVEKTANMDDKSGIGGIVGYASHVLIDNSDIAMYTIHQSGLSLAWHHLGGFIGNAEYVDITNSYVDRLIFDQSSKTDNNSSADMHEVGGFIGHAFECYIDNCSINDRVELKQYISGNEHVEMMNVGGIAGLSQKSVFQNITVNHVIIGNEQKGNFADFSLEMNNVGGVIGSSTKDSISTLTINNGVEVSYITNTDDEKLRIENIGGVIGTMDSTTARNITTKVKTNIKDINDTDHPAYQSRNVGCLAGNSFQSIFFSTHIENCDILGGKENLGGLIGYSYGDTIQENEILDPNIMGDSNLSCMAGTVKDSQIYNADSQRCKLEGACIGGLVGSGNPSIMDSKVFDNTFTGKGKTGGLVGCATDVTIQNSCAEYQHLTDDVALGGLVGYVESSLIINNSYASGKLTGKASIGGVVGTVTPKSMPVIDNSSSYVHIEIIDTDKNDQQYVGGIGGNFDFKNTKLKEIRMDNLNTVHQFSYNGAKVSKIKTGDFIGLLEVYAEGFLSFNVGVALILPYFYSISALNSNVDKIALLSHKNVAL